MEAPNLIYMFEFMVENLLITHNNHCAPDDYPTTVEISFRSCVYVDLSDRDYAACLRCGQRRCGKRVIFILDSPITPEDSILIHIYRKRTKRSKFLVGLTEIKVKSLFDRVKKKFDQENFNWCAKWLKQLAQLPKLKEKDEENDDDEPDESECFEIEYERREQLQPMAEVAKQLVPFFNLCQQQAGNITLITRLTCHGPNIASAYCKKGSKYCYNLRK